MGRGLRSVCFTPLVLWCALGCALAQDERRISSPDGTLEFRLFVGQPEPGGLSRLAYQVWLRGQPLIQTSFLGFDIRDQEPMLGCNVGLTGSHISEEAGSYRSLTAEYMQNGSIGRRIDLEVRVWDDGVAFRYVIPNSTPLDKLLIKDELTEFDFAHAVREPQTPSALPYVVEQPGAGWVAIAESRSDASVKAVFARVTPTRMITHLAAAFEGVSPMTWPWRVILVATDRPGLQSAIDARTWDR